MMNKMFKAAIMVITMAGFSVMGTMSASANDVGLMKYAKDLNTQEANLFKPFKVASRRSRRRNRAIAGIIGAGIAAVIISEAVRSKRHRRRYRNDYYNDRAYYRGPSRRTCRKWARRCDYGNRRACRKWHRRCY